MLHAVKLKAIIPPENLVYDEIFLIECVVYAARMPHIDVLKALKVKANGERYDIVGNPAGYVVAHILSRSHVAVEIVE
jgi:hypothetical protein